MKVLRFPLLVFGVLVALLAVVLLLAFTPAVQTWAARRALAADPDLSGHVERVSVGLKRTQIEGLRLERPGMTLTVPSATIDLALHQVLRKQVYIRRLVSKGWTLDLTTPPRAAAAAGPASASLLGQLGAIGLGQIGSTAAAASASEEQKEAGFAGVLRQLNLPVDLAVDAAELEGEIVYATAAGAPSRAQVRLSGGQLGEGRIGEFKITGSTRVVGVHAPVEELAFAGIARAAMDTPRTFRQLTAELDLDAKGAQFPDGARLRAEGAAERTGADETYAVSLRSVDAHAGKQLVDVRASYPADAKLLSGTWKIDARDADLTPFVLGIPLPDFVADGQGQFETDSAFREVHAVGRFEAMVDRLEVFHEALEVVGSTRLSGEFDLVQHGNFIRVVRLEAEVAGVQPIVSVRALQGFEVNPSTGELRLAQPETDLVQVKLQGLPLAWVKPFVSEMMIEGGDLRGELVARALNGGVAFHSVAPLEVTRLGVSQEGQPWLKDVDVTVRLEGDYSRKGWHANVSEFSLSNAGSPWLVASLKAGQDSGEQQPIKSAGRYRVELPLAVKQPALADFHQLERGQLTGEFTAVVTGALMQFAAQANLTGLGARGVDQVIPNVFLTARADVQPDGLIKLQAPLLIERAGRKSDLETTAEIRRTGELMAIDAQLVSETLHVEDAHVLLLPFQSSTEADPDVPEVSTDEPFWSGFTGELRLAFKKVIYSPDVQAGNVTGTLKIGPESITVEDLKAVMGEGSEAKLNGGLRYHSAEREKYSLQTDLNVANVNPGPILAAFSSEKQPPVEGQFNVTGKVVSSAPTLETLSDKASADIKMTSRSGRLNIFAANAAAAAAGSLQKGASTAAAVVELFSGLMGETKVERAAARTRAGLDALGRFGNMPFDQLNLEVTHRPGEDTKIRDFSLISPDIRFVGSGGIQNVQGVSWMDRPLKVDLQMAVRGDQARDLKLLGALRNEPDPLGYFPLMERIPIEGSLSKIRSDAIAKLMQKYLPQN